MMKWALIIAVVLTVGATAGMATVFDFSSVSCLSGTTTVTVCPIGSTATLGFGYTLGNINFLYEDSGDSSTTAQISAGGVDGFAGGSGLSGILEFNFSSPTTGVAFNFNLTPNAVYTDGAQVTLYDIGSVQLFSSALIPTDLSGNGSFSYTDWPTADISHVQIYFSANPLSLATAFHLSPLEYDVAPEPGTFALTGSFLFLLGFGSRKLLKRRS